MSMFNSVWYKTLTKPALSPPNWVFLPVWTILYIMMFTSLYIYSISVEDNKYSGYAYFIIQFLLNVSWSPVFFGLKNILFALCIIILLDITIILTIKEFYKASKISAYLLIPYFVWVIFATYLNISYLILNTIH